MSRREVFLEAAGLVVPLVAHEHVAARWSEASALTGLSVGALATHLVGQVVSVHAVATVPSASSRDKPVSVMEHYARADWVAAGPDDEANVSIRDRAEHSAQEGHAAVVERLERSTSALRRWPPDKPTSVRMPWWDWSLSMDDFILTRMMEVMVHSDDLAVSIGVPTPEFPRSVARPVLTLLTALAERRHGQPALIRALTRTERAPQSLTVF